MFSLLEVGGHGGFVRMRCNSHRLFQPDWFLRFASVGVRRCSRCLFPVTLEKKNG